jgi:nitroimidazol reductase NimA-like FMN-containing flavoprotein (pyridoxamine 5'-phosphate oxidase superfamily)
MVVYRRANRQYVAMSEEEVWKFLESQNKIYVAFTKNDGYPHVSPIWFCIEEGKIFMRTHDYKVKTGLARSGKACCVTDDGYLYRELRGVIVWGRSRVLAEEKLIDHINQVLDRKYAQQQWKPSEMPRRWVDERRGETRAFIEVTPEIIDSWDNSKVR